MVTEFGMWLATGALSLAVIVFAAGCLVRCAGQEARRRGAERAEEQSAASDKTRAVEISDAWWMRERVEDGFYRWHDLAVVGIVMGIYLSALFQAWAGHRGGNSEVTFGGLMNVLVGQAFLLVLVVVSAATRESLVSWLGLTQKNWWKMVLFGAPLVVVMTWGFTLGLGLTGWMDWVKVGEGSEDARQEAVRAFMEVDDPRTLAMLCFMAVLAAPLIEETIFRGYVYPVLKRFSGRRAATVASALLFAVVHNNSMALLPLAFLAVLLAVAYEVSGTIWVPVGAHMIFNSVTVILQLAARMGWVSLPT